MKQPAQRKSPSTRILAMSLAVVASAGLNLYLSAQLFSHRRPLPTLSESATGNAATKASELTLIPSSTNLPAEADSATRPSFHWREVGAADYRQYIANLRAVGCPEPIIQDIIQADVNQLFAARFHAIWKPAATAYWQKHRNTQPSPEQRKQLAALDKEKGALFQELLGFKPNPQALVDTLHLQVHGSEQQLLFLSSDKREAAVSALASADFETKETELHARGRYSSDDEKKLFDEKLKVLADVLSPEELEEFRLRNSQTAQTLRMELEYFDCTPEEFKRLLAAKEE